MPTARLRPTLTPRDRRVQLLSQSDDLRILHPLLDGRFQRQTSVRSRVVVRDDELDQDTVRGHVVRREQHARAWSCACGMGLVQGIPPRSPAPRSSPWLRTWRTRGVRASDRASRVSAPAESYEVSLSTAFAVLVLVGHHLVVVLVETVAQQAALPCCSLSDERHGRHAPPQSYQCDARPEPDRRTSTTAASAPKPSGLAPTSSSASRSASCRLSASTETETQRVIDTSAVHV